MKLSLIIPCYNESSNLPGLIERCREVVRRSDVECILVDNGSTDESAEILSKHLSGADQIRSVRVPINQGYGYGILSGLKVARGEILAWTHADLQADPVDVLRGLKLFEESGSTEALFVKGKRYGRPAGDVFFTMGMSIFETILLRKSLWDINAQPTMFPRHFFETLRQPPHDFALDLYVYYSARRAGMCVKRFPVSFTKRLHGQSRWNINWRAKCKFIQRTVAFSIQLYRSPQTDAYGNGGKHR